jgi:beta-glucanase (GH16 family)
MDSSVDSWQDHFDFVTQAGSATGNHELQNYRPQQCVVKDRSLELTLRHEGREYISGKAVSKFTLGPQGSLEVTFEAPAYSPGLWPAIWLLPQPSDWPLKGELDLYESMHKSPQDALAGFSTLHFGSQRGRDFVYPGHWGLSLGSYPTKPGPHTLRLDWSLDAASMSVDGCKVWQRSFADFRDVQHISQVHHLPYCDPGAVLRNNLRDYRLILNLAYGGTPFQQVQPIAEASLKIHRVKLH